MQVDRFWFQWPKCHRYRRVGRWQGHWGQISSRRADIFASSDDVIPGPRALRATKTTAA